jgi:ABC-type nitrate/sulfonate/bicarbonate transport system ATPase subunit
MGSSATVLEIVGVSKRYEGRTGPVQALQSVDLGIREGEFISFVGPSGCGKTTLLKIIDGLLPATSGKIVLDGEELVGVSKSLAFVFQDINLLPWRTVVQNVEIGLVGHGLPAGQRRERALGALALVGLSDVADAAPYTLSGGMQQRVGVARALAVDPRVLLMDEPFGHLDNFTRETLQIEVSKIWRRMGMTIVFVTHDVDEAIFLSDRIAVFDSNPGRIVEILEVGLPHPRWEIDVPAQPGAVRLRHEILERLEIRNQVLV